MAEQRNGTGRSSQFAETNVNVPVVGTDIANKDYVDAVASGLSPKTSVIAASNAALPAYTYANGAGGVGATITENAPGALTLDGVTGFSVGDRVLIKDETAGNAPYNGIYTVTNPGSGLVPFVLTRATDNDQPAEFPGAFVFCVSGTVNSGAGFVCTNTAPVVVGTTPITWTQFSGTQIIAGDGLTKTGNTLDVGAGDGIQADPDSVTVKLDGATLAKGVSGLKVADNVFIRADGTVAFTADQSMGSHKLTNVTDPASAQDADTKAARDAAIAAAIAQVGRAFAFFDGAYSYIRPILTSPNNFLTDTNCGLNAHGSDFAQTTRFFDSDYKNIVWRVQNANNQTTIIWFNTPSGSGFYRQATPMMRTKVKYVGQLTDIRSHWFGFSAGDLELVTTSVPNNTIAFRFCEGTDTNFACIVRDGSATQTLDSGVLVELGKIYELIIRFDASGNAEFLIGVDGATPTVRVGPISSGLPAATLDMNVSVGHSIHQVSGSIVTSDIRISYLMFANGPHAGDILI